MSKVKFKRFIKLQVLEQIGRRMLGKFFDRFKADLAETGIHMPPVDLADETYYPRVIELLQAPEGLPARMVDALFAIDEMADHAGQECLENATAQAGLPFRIHPDSTHAEIALQIWMETPELLQNQHYKQKLLRLSVFDYFSGKRKTGLVRESARVGHETMELMKQDLDKWFAEHNRGEETAQIDFHEIEGEQWYLIRHGDTYTRTTKVDKRHLERLHFRPAKDDLVVYSPEYDELRIHAGTKGEKDLYRQQFGQRLHGNDHHFRACTRYTLEPLRTEGEQALDPAGIEGISRIVLRKYKVAFGDNLHDSLIRSSRDIFQMAKMRNWSAIPNRGHLVSAVFDVYFQDTAKPRRVQIRTPNTLKLGRHSDAPLVHRWLRHKGFVDGAMIVAG